jgi:hypothetical protein
MENTPEWHHRIPTESECRIALRELEGSIPAEKELTK